MKFEDQYLTVVDRVIAEIGDFDLIVQEEALSEPSGQPSHYLVNHRHEYLRTVQDLGQHFAGRMDSRPKVLEIGSFFGVVSIALAELGFDVVAADNPEYIEMEEQQQRYARYGVNTASVRLEDFELPFATDEFDAVVMCEVLEHLNFNPLPLLKEINRILRPDGLFYLSLPNGACLPNRLALLRGRAIQVSTDSFFDQLDPSTPDIVNGHWKEYTALEIRNMLEPLGFAIDKQYFFCLSECIEAPSIRNRVARKIYDLFPAFKENQTTLATKAARTEIEFTIPNTVHKTLSKL